MLVLVRRALRLSLASIAWTSITSTAEIGFGVRRHVLTLVAFGLVGLLDAAGSVMLTIHFRHALRHDVLADHHERRAALVISAGLVVLGVGTFGQAVRELIVGHTTNEAVAGTVIAACSVGVLGLLATMKWRTGKAIGSPALVGDALLSGSGAVLAVVAVVGASVGSSVDPVAAAVIAGAAAAYGSVLLSQQFR